MRGDVGDRPTPYGRLEHVAEPAHLLQRRERLALELHFLDEFVRHKPEGRAHCHLGLDLLLLLQCQGVDALL
ncbi:hypothetical protein [Sphingobium chlorophenolicum]|uniref:hypothetical protein n=1 Tax=Sphingobium chlorophenolicum TaxID=46429 RepID=UPI00059DE518|nr:hypothetical protein [Sphingobium chlorophenolicum]